MKCPVCHAENIPEGSLFCNMCGVNLREEMQKIEEEQERKRKAGLLPLIEKTVYVGSQRKTIRVLCKDVTMLGEPVDLLTISAAPYHYHPTPRSVIGALDNNLSISVQALADSPLLDLRDRAGCWISKELAQKPGGIARIGGVEIPRYYGKKQSFEELMISAIKSYMHLLDILGEMDIDIKTVALPFLGTGRLKLSVQLLAIPLINEVMQLLLRNPSVENVIFMEKDYEKAMVLANALNVSYSLQVREGGTEPQETKKPSVFISYTEKGDRNVAEIMCQYLKSRGISYWFAPKDIVMGDYASEIMHGIRSCTHFICIISSNSMKSSHVLNEVDLAFQRINEGVVILPFRLDDSTLEPSFQYYLSRMHWSYGTPPPIDQKIKEFIDRIFD